MPQRWYVFSDCVLITIFSINLIGSGEVLLYKSSSGNKNCWVHILCPHSRGAILSLLLEEDELSRAVFCWRWFQLIAQLSMVPAKIGQQLVLGDGLFV